MEHLSPAQALSWDLCKLVMHLATRSGCRHLAANFTTPKAQQVGGLESAAPHGLHVSGSQGSTSLGHPLPHLGKRSTHCSQCSMPPGCCNTFVFIKIGILQEIKYCFFGSQAFKYLGSGFSLRNSDQSTLTSHPMRMSSMD